MILKPNKHVKASVGSKSIISKSKFGLGTALITPAVNLPPEGCTSTGCGAAMSFKEK